MGLEAAVSVDARGSCPVADASAETGERIESVRKSSVGTRAVEEFELAADAPEPEGMTEVFGDDRYSVYRFERDRDEPCFCECIEAFGCPIVDIRSEEGELRVAFRPTDVETLQEIVTTLRETFGGVSLEHLVQSGDPEEADTVVVDRGRLTDRQREVLQTAYEMGYFEHPKGSNAGEVADELGINAATLRGHLSAAQSKLMDAILDE
jgi:predicted DNA binding protein